MRLRYSATPWTIDMKTIDRPQSAAATAQETVAGRVLDPQKALETYNTVFTQIGWWGIGFGVLMLAISPWPLAMMAMMESHTSHAKVCAVF